MSVMTPAKAKACCTVRQFAARVSKRLWGSFNAERTNEIFEDDLAALRRDFADALKTGGDAWDDYWRLVGWHLMRARRVGASKGAEIARSVFREAHEET